MELDAYRASAEAFLEELTAEYYRHYAGLQEDYALEPIYARHPELFTRAAVEGLRERAGAAPPGTEQRRRLTALVDFAIDGYVGAASKETEAELARREAATTLEVDGERIGLRESSVIQANEPDAERRALIEQARLDALGGELNGLYRELTERQHACARELGWASYRAMCEESKLLDLEALHAQCRGFSAASRASYLELLEPEARRTLGFGLTEMRRSDLSRFFRAPELDRSFPAGRLLASFERTMHGLGIDVHHQRGVRLDVDPRPTKSPRAFCAPVRPPDEVYLVLTPKGGREDYTTMFHEGGHTEHYAHVAPEVPFEFRCLGDNSITEAFAFLFQHLVDDPEWLRRCADVADLSALVSHASAERLAYLRRYSAKLSYELELHGRDAALDALPERYSELIGDALGIEWSGETFLQDVDPGFYCVCYLQAWALETHLRAHLRERFGPAWFDSTEAGDVLRALWHDGQRLGAGDLLGQLTGERLDFSVLLDDLGLARSE